jgi:DnaJ domain
MRDPYEVLDVPRSATADEIEKSFRRLAKELHPDVNNNDPESVERFVEINRARDILGDKDKRKAFDRGEFGGGLVREGIAYARFRRSTPTWLIVTSLIVGLVLGVVSTLLIQSQMPQREVSAKSDGKNSRLPGFGAGEQPAREAPAEQPVRRAQPAPRLIVQQNVSSVTVDSSALGVQVSGEAVGLAVEISRLPIGMTISAGRSLGTGRWRIPASEVADARIHLPAGFHGAIDLAVDLRLADDTVVDRQSLYRLDHQQIELLVKRSRELISVGDVAAARASLERAAEARDARAALALGATYDPILLSTLRPYGLDADVSLARGWYEKASELGSQEAQKLLAALNR